MAGDRPVVDGRDIPESKLQDAIRRPRKFVFDWFDELVSDYNSQTDHVGAQDEASEAREVGDSVRPKSHLIPSDPNAFVVDEWDPIKKVTDDFAREMELRFAYEGKKVAMGHCDLTKDPDGSIHARINFFPQNPR